MTEEEIREFIRQWDEENRTDYLDKAEELGQDAILTLFVGYPARLISAAIAENNRRWEERLRQAGIKI